MDGRYILKKLHFSTSKVEESPKNQVKQSWNNVSQPKRVWYCITKIAPLKALEPLRDRENLSPYYDIRIFEPIQIDQIRNISIKPYSQHISYGTNHTI